MISGQHIVSAFDDELIAVQAKITEMGGLAEDMLAQTLESLEKRDAASALEVVARDKRLDALEMELEKLVTQILALRQPMAQDLRLLIVALKMTPTIERIGDLAKNIARRSAELANEKPLRLTSSIVRMGNEAQRQLTEALDAFTSRDTVLARTVWRRDVEIDELYNSLFRELITYMMEDQRLISLGSQYLFIAKNLERIGDHATHISEMTYYLVEGEPLGDDRPRGEPMMLNDLD